MPYKLEQVAESLRISKTGQSLCMDWGVAMSLPVKQALSFLEPGFIIQSGKYVFLTDEMIQELVDFVGSIARDEYLLSFFWYCYYRILNDPTLILSWEEQWPPLVTIWARKQVCSMCL